MQDFNREELPCIVFANWRGFSGGQRDMFDEVLKFGSMIVDAFVAYQQPLFVYIPPHAELRGGAWVVVDSTINADVMEFYAAEDARGGVLEATGAASIKYRDKEIRATAGRLDPELIRINEQLQQLPRDALNQAERDELLKQIRLREQCIIGVFRQIAIHFADLHDTPGRMKAKGVIRQQVTWADSRVFFFWRLKRRLAEFEIANRIMKYDSTITSKTQAIQVLETWVSKGQELSLVEMNDADAVNWLQNNRTFVDKNVMSLKYSTISNDLVSQLQNVLAGAEEEDGGMIQQALSSLSADQKSRIIKLMGQL